MIRLINKEGGLSNGFNFYRQSDPSSAGFKFVIRTKNFIRIWTVRYSKVACAWSNWYSKVDRSIDPETGMKRVVNV